METGATSATVIFYSAHKITRKWMQIADGHRLVERGERTDIHKHTINYNLALLTAPDECRVPGRIMPPRPLQNITINI